MREESYNVYTVISNGDGHSGMDIWSQADYEGGVGPENGLPL